MQFQRIEPKEVNKEPKASRRYNAVVHITLPPHAVPGEVFEVFIGTQIIRVTCPIQFKAGDTVRIKCPAFPVSPPMKEGNCVVRTFVDPIGKNIGYIVTVPPDIQPGERFRVKIDGQPEFPVRCPLTHRPGMSLRVRPPKLTREGVLEEYGKDAVQE